MLSGAKHLLFLVENKQKQILRFAQNDIAQQFFNKLLEALAAAAALRKGTTSSRAGGVATVNRITIDRGLVLAQEKPTVRKTRTVATPRAL